MPVRHRIEDASHLGLSESRKSENVVSAPYTMRQAAKGASVYGPKAFVGLVKPHRYDSGPGFRGTRTACGRAAAGRDDVGGLAAP
jgi:hypothetical protein